MNCEKKQRAYISYMKSSCGEYAFEIFRSLRLFGYGSFYDKKSPRSGEFDKNLFLAINNSEWFILILDKHIFENYPEEGNWIHTEVAHAIEQKKKFICIKTPGLDAKAEIPDRLRDVLCVNNNEVLTLDRKNPEKTALSVRDIFESDGNVGKFEKTVNRIFSGIYFWRILLFPLLGSAIMGTYLMAFYDAYRFRSSVDAVYIFERFGVGRTITFNLLFVILGTLLCGIFMYITKRVVKMEIIPLFLADVAGIVFLPMIARKIVDTIFELGKAMYWTNSMGLTVWSVCEYTAVYMVIITLVFQILLYLFKRSKDFV